jgi:carboxymethylenebutenolidase
VTQAGSAYVVAPSSGRGPGVLVLHSWWGLTPFFRDVCDRLADEGFVAMAPDMHNGQTADRPDEAEAILRSADPNEGARLALASASALRGLPATPDGPIGVLGFSMGASWALWLSARVPESVAAAVVFYGSQDIDMEGSRSAYQGHFADEDDFVSDDDVAYLEALLGLAGRPVEFHRYPGTRHWFFEEDREGAFDGGAAALAWQRTVEFLRAHLG